MLLVLPIRSRSMRRRFFQQELLLYQNDYPICSRWMNNGIFYHGSNLKKPILHQNPHHRSKHHHQGTCTAADTAPISAKLETRMRVSNLCFFVSNFYFLSIQAHPEWQDDNLKSSPIWILKTFSFVFMVSFLS